MSAALKIELGRRYRFAASHRLHSSQLSEEENCRVYGKCNNPYGHGLNYTVEVCLSGEIDPSTGMIANLADLDAFVERQFLEEFDHRSLNEDVPVFRGKVPTTENGSAMAGINVAETLRKNKKITITTSAMVAAMVNWISWNAARITCPRSPRTIRFTLPGSSRSNPGSSRRIASITWIVLPPGWRATPMTIPGVPSLPDSPP